MASSGVVAPAPPIRTAKCWGFCARGFCAGRPIGRRRRRNFYSVTSNSFFSLFLPIRNAQIVKTSPERHGSACAAYVTSARDLYQLPRWNESDAEVRRAGAVLVGERVEAHLRAWQVFACGVMDHETKWTAANGKAQRSDIHVIKPVLRLPARHVGRTWPISAWSARNGRCGRVSASVHR